MVYGVFVRDQVRMSILSEVLAGSHGPYCLTVFFIKCVRAQAS